MQTPEHDMTTLTDVARPVAENVILTAMLRIGGAGAMLGLAVLGFVINGWLTDIKGDIANIKTRQEQADVKSNEDSQANAGWQQRVTNLEQQMTRGREERTAQINSIYLRMDRQDEKLDRLNDKLTDVLKLLAGVVATQQEMQRQGRRQ